MNENGRYLGFFPIDFVEEIYNDKGLKCDRMVELLTQPNFQLDVANMRIAEILFRGSTLVFGEQTVIRRKVWDPEIEDYQEKSLKLDFSEPGSWVYLRNVRNILDSEAVGNNPGRILRTLDNLVT